MRSGTRLMIVAAIYVIALIGLPFGHHDLICHVTSSTHCANCHFSSAADNSGTQAGAAAMTDEVEIISLSPPYEVARLALRARSGDYRALA